MLKKEYVVTFLAVVTVGIIFCFYYNAQIIHSNVKDIQEFFMNNKNIQITDGNSKSMLDYKSIISSSPDLGFKESSSSDEDNELIFNYEGGEIGPEWEWVKNISIVYTWVDGNDIDFLDIKSKYNGGIRKSNSRDRSADELRYSIRSLTKYLPWHNGTIYLLTNDQVPKWLDTSNPRIKLVFHKDIFPEHVTPTYDSSTIELFLDKIPGITERFIYFNDDFFVNSYIHPAYFFTSNGFYLKVYRRHLARISKERISKIINTNSLHEIFQASKYFTNEIIKEYFDENFVYLNACHSGYVFYRDLFEPFRQLFQDEVKLLCADRFRSPFKPHFLYLYHTYVQYATNHEEFPNKLGGNGRAKEFEGFTLPENRSIEKYSAEIVSDGTVDIFFRYGKVTDNSTSNRAYFDLFKNDRNYLVYNLNDIYTKEQSLYEFTEFMITRYPEPSEFEKKIYVQTEQAILPAINDTSVLSTDVITGVAEIVDENYANDFKEKVEQYKLDTIKNYLNLKDSLAGPKKEYSDREIEESRALLKYRGKIVSQTWRWAHNMSFVYILENASHPNSVAYNNELKYSIRSLEQYLPWFNGNLFIVTQKEITDELPWLNMNNLRIHVINQDKIIPSEAAQTQNVHIIEMYLDKIPGISERFVYLKSNHFFIDYTHPRFFFNKEFYPKYNLDVALSETEIPDEEEKNKAFFNTYDVIKDYFSKNYVTTYRYFKDAPYPFYRDLFEPCRKLYENEVNEMLSHMESTDNDILPFYLVTTYNIYGTDQPYYPEYVGGYGKVRDADPPNLNEGRTIDYYGFDITSPLISESTMMLGVPFTNNRKEKIKFIKKLNKAKKLFFSLDIKNEGDLKDLDKSMETLFTEKSSFEL